MKQRFAWPVLEIWLLIALATHAVHGGGTGNDLLPDIPLGARTARFASIADIGAERVIDIAHAGDDSGRLFLVSPNGVIRIFRDGAVLATPFLNDPAEPSDIAMTGLTFHPNFATNGKIYVITGEALPNPHTPHYVSPQDPTAGAFDNVVFEYQVDPVNPDIINMSTKRELLRIRQAATCHQVDDLVFGADGMLTIAVGDGGCTREGTPTHYETNAQLTTNPFGKILRIDVDTIGPNGRYGIPATNPFASGAGGNVPEIFAWGVRNPWRMTVDRATGDIYAAVNGDFTIEWIVRVELARNYGWAVREGSFLWDPLTGDASLAPAPDPAFTAPVAEYDHNGSQAFASVIGGYVYRGARLPEFFGTYLCLDWVAGVVIAMDPATGALERVTVDPTGWPILPFRDITWGEDEDGELYIGTDNGHLLALVPVTHDFVRGNCNGQGATDIADAVYLLAYLFSSGPLPSCLDACDVDDNGNFNIADAIGLLYAIFQGGPPLAPPWPSCGSDSTVDAAGCSEFDLCP
ncbi:MAG: PQQ-dependent sugar dehydrogenase [Planctomycetota bacterium]